jgi:hypothetical protein
MNDPYLPPGCTSPDGGIDHTFEQALDDLCSAIESAEEATTLLRILRAIRGGSEPKEH